MSQDSGVEGNANTADDSSSCIPQTPNQQDTVSEIVDIYADSLLNLSLLDPPRWGWSAGGGVIDVLPPHERARRRFARDAFLESKKQCLSSKEKCWKKIGMEQTASTHDETFGEASGATNSGRDIATCEPVSTAAQKNEASCSSAVDDATAAALASVNQSDTDIGCSTFRNEDTGVAVESSGKHSEIVKNTVSTVPTPENVVLVPPVSIDNERQTETTGALVGRSGNKDQGRMEHEAYPEREKMTDQNDANTNENNAVQAASSTFHEKKQTSEEASSPQERVGGTGNKNNEESKYEESGEEKKMDGNEKPRVIRINAMSDKGDLDIFSYHRGRAGHEIRDEDSGELLCDADRSDTNFSWDAPKMLVKITVTFPLGEGEECDNLTDDDDVDSSLELDTPGRDRECKSDSNVRAGCRRNRSAPSRLSSDETITYKTECKRNCEVPQFQDVIEWDLSDSRTPTPMAFAIDVAIEFGLTFGQTLDLASSIQKQIDDFVGSNVAYHPPISAKDPLGMDRVHSHLVGTRSTMIPFSLHGGNDVTRQQLLSAQENAGRESHGSKHKAAKSRGNLLHPGAGDGRWRRQTQSSVKYATEPEYREEIWHRAKTEWLAEMTYLSQTERKGAPVGVLQYETDYVCHICHGRRPKGARFGCGNPSHAFCENHFVTRLGFSIINAKKETMTLDYCPICCLTCFCAKCVRRLDSVSTQFRKLCKAQGSRPEEVPFEVLELCSGMKTKRPNDARHICSESSSKRQSGDSMDQETNVLFVKQQSDSSDHASRGKRKREEKVIENHDTEQDAGAKQVQHSKRARKTEQQALFGKDNGVIKVPASAFPREICGGKDIDPSKKDDFRTVFTPNGSYVRYDIPDVPGQMYQAPQESQRSQSHAASEPVPMLFGEEDGNVDYCHFCQDKGELICCDRCPRAFHVPCISIDPESLPDKDWECPICLRDKVFQPDDEVSGRESRDLMIVAFVDYDYCNHFTENLTALSKIHEMVLKLMNFDFGHSFREPVDTKANPAYLEIIEKPMDLGTVASNLVNGIYAKQFMSEERDKTVANDLKKSSKLDDAVLEVLKDIEMIWHNCFVFNQEGSSIYRMANVQRRKSHMILRRSIDRHLSENVKQRLNEFVQHCELFRGKVSKVNESLFSSFNEKKSLPSCSRSSFQRSEIKVPFSYGGTSRIIAVLDPQTNMIIKQYSRLKSAVFAATKLKNLGYASEFPVSDYMVKQILRRSATEPSLLLFGYRWVYADDLRRGAVKIVDPSSHLYPATEQVSSAYAVLSSNGKEPTSSFTDFVERIDDAKFRTFFASIDDAYLSVNDPKNVSQAIFEESILRCPPNGEVYVMGYIWRRVPRKLEHGDTSETEGRNTDSFFRTENEDDASLIPVMSSGLCAGDECFFQEDGLAPSFPSNVIIVKEDLCSGVKLGGFETMKTAYYDWLNTRESSVSLGNLDSHDISVFQTRYLNGCCTVDGIQWKPIKHYLSYEVRHPQSNKTDNKQQTEGFKSPENLLLQNETEIGNPDGSRVVVSLEDNGRAADSAPGTSHQRAESAGRKDLREMEVIDRDKLAISAESDAIGSIQRTGLTENGSHLRVELPNAAFESKEAGSSCSIADPETRKSKDTKTVSCVSAPSNHVDAKGDLDSFGLSGAGIQKGTKRQHPSNSFAKESPSTATKKREVPEELLRCKDNDDVFSGNLGQKGQHSFRASEEESKEGRTAGALGAIRVTHPSNLVKREIAAISTSSLTVVENI